MGAQGTSLGTRCFSGCFQCFLLWCGFVGLWNRPGNESPHLCLQWTALLFMPWCFPFTYVIISTRVQVLIHSFLASRNHLRKLLDLMLTKNACGDGHPKQWHHILWQGQFNLRELSFSSWRLANLFLANSFDRAWLKLDEKWILFQLKCLKRLRKGNGTYS